jgi:hypothetical protein
MATRWIHALVHVSAVAAVSAVTWIAHTAVAAHQVCAVSISMAWVGCTFIDIDTIATVA